MIVAMRDNSGHIRGLLCSDYAAITGWGGHLIYSSRPISVANHLACNYPGASKHYLRMKP